MSNISVSVIIPAYNVEEWLGNCINSVLMQSLENIEVIVVNDGSTDTTQEVIEKFVALNPDKVKAIYNEHSGPSVSRNIALKQAKGEYISFLDADDEMAFNMLEKMYYKAKENDADLVLCGRQYVGAEEGVYLPPEIETYTNIFSSPKLLSDTSSFVWDKIFKKKTIDDYGFTFNESIHYAEDALFIYTFLYHANTVCSVREPLYYYTVRRAGSITGAMDDRMFHEIEACKELAVFYKNKGYFKLFYSSLLWITIGFWGRKFYSFYKYPKGKKLQAQFSCDFIDFLDKYYHGQWKHYLRTYQTTGNKRKYKINYWKTKKSLVKIYIYCPAFLKKSIKALRSSFSRLKSLSLSKIRRALKPKNEPYYFKYLSVRETKPVAENHVLYVSNSGDNLACNPFYLLREANQREGYKLFVGSKDPVETKKVLWKNGIKATVLKMDSGAFQDVLATAKYLVTNYRLPTYFTKRQEQVLMNSWHGTPLKYLGKHMNNGIRDLANVQSQFLACDFLLYPNYFTKEKMMDAFSLNDLYENEVVLKGYPRNAAFYDASSSENIRKSLGLLDKKVFVFMPTWRGKSVSATNKAKDTEVFKLLKQLDGLLHNDTVVYVKLHNLAKKQIANGYTHIRPFPDNLEIYQFLNAADGLITDYSSVFFDFANTRKDIILFTYDKEEYISERGLYLDMDCLPFTTVNTVEELASYIDGWNGYAATKGYEEFVETFCAEDNLETPTRVNDCLFAHNPNGFCPSRSYNVIFAPDLGIPHVFHECLAAKADDVLFVFSAKNISATMEAALRTERCKDLKYIIVQNEKILTLEERRDLEVWRRTGELTKAAKCALKREIERMLPNLKINKATSLSQDDMFTSIAAFVNAECATELSR